MDSRIEQLLEKYWASESSIQEEKELKELMTNADNSEEMEELKAMFGYFQSEQELSLGDDFDQEVLAMIEAEPETKVISISGYFKRYAGVAAAMLVLITSSYFFMQQQKTYEQEDTFDSPELALQELKKQLVMVSNYMNSGSSNLDKLGSMSKMDAGMESLKYMGDAARGMEPISEMDILEEKF
ncbi:hypothetical protein EV198_2070 [Roseivirga ehrenbergii]|uniref:Uncharacterized protein n=1 Tax=Roseivirga ehrenbergii (strain DSM 102268 / JCM 13514 / KCTC 12282 / NCIMB 14502 / KMM 6017) TaxID=279360 RepID=A0A150WZF7_ROSEK|nr:hypothetical protein [Roseivirga ehrenbergii]KYG71672.1 hypothetical protein MB14_10155 [Roseivirga ehrenbergii]TCL07637.1 hypothetical protein EV198_2070 [Roseivirga ehrenbergii]